METSEQSLKSEIDLTKTALLYGDSVTLFSPKLQPLVAMESLRRGDNIREFLRFVQNHMDLPPSEEAVLRQISSMLHSIPPNLMGQLRDQMKEPLRQVETMWRGMGGDEIKLAVDVGVLKLDQVIHGRGAEAANTIQRDVTRILHTILDDGSTYPLFDEMISAVSASLRLDASNATSRRRGRETGLASGLTVRLPSFPNASMSEILDIRKVLAPTLGAFRVAIHSMSGQLDVSPTSPEFQHIVDELWNSIVAPALDELEDRIAHDSSLRDLVLNPLSTVGAPLAGIISLGLTQSPVIASAVGASLLAANTLAEVRTQSNRRIDTTRSEFYFLYAANQRMGAR